MVEIARYEGARRLKGSAVLAVAVGVVALFFTFFFPSFQEGGGEDIAETFPPAMEEMFGIEAMGTIEGFLAVEIYNFVWLLLLGVYFAYTAAGIIAKDIQDGHLDLLLSYPVSRRRVLLERYAALVVPLVLLNLLVPLFVYGGIVAIGESIEIGRLVMVHLMSIPFFLVCAAIGVFLSVIVSRVSVAQRVALGSIFVLWVLESIIGTVGEFEWLSSISPTTFYNPTDILVHADYDMGETGILLLATVILLVVSIQIFTRRDL